MLQPKPKFTPPSDAVVVESGNSFVPPSDAVVLKKKESTESTSTTQEKNGDSVQTIGSLDGVGSNGFPAIDKNLGVPGLKPDLKTVEQLANPPKSKATLQAEQNNALKYQKFKEFSALPDEIKKANAQKVEDEVNGVGFLNNVANFGKEAYNTVIEGMSNTPMTAGLKQLKTDTRPLAEEQKEAKYLMIRQGVKPKDINSNTILELAKKIKLQKLNDSDIESRKKEFLSNTDIDFEDLQKGANVELSKISNKDKELLKQKAMLEPVLRDSDNRLTELNKQLANFKKNNQQPTAEFVNEYNYAIKYHNDILKDIQKTDNQFADNRDKIGDLKTNLDLFKRQYGKVNNFVSNIGATALDLAAGGFGIVDYGFNAAYGALGIDTGPKENSEIVTGLRGASKNIRDRIAKPINIDNIEDVYDFGDWMANTVIANQVPIYGLIATGPGGIVALGGSSLGTKYGDMVQEMNPDNPVEGQILKNYSDAELAWKPVGFGIAETASALVDAHIMKGAARVLASATQPERRLISQTIAKRLLDVGKETIKGGATEAVDEMATQGVENLIDGKPFTEGMKDAGGAGGAMGALIPFFAGNIAIATKPFSIDNKIQNSAKKTIALEKELANPNLSEDAKKIIKTNFEESKKTTENLLKKQVKDISKMPNENFQEILKIEEKQAKLKEKAIEIKTQEGLSDDIKKQLLSDFSTKFNELETDRVDILSGKKTMPKIEETNEKPQEVAVTETKLQTEVPKQSENKKVIIPDEIKDEHSRAMEGHQESIADLEKKLAEEKALPWLKRDRQEQKWIEEDIKFHKESAKMLEENPVQYYKDFLKSEKASHENRLKEGSEDGYGKTYKDLMIERFGSTDFETTNSRFIEDINSKIAKLEDANKPQAEVPQQAEAEKVELKNEGKADIPTKENINERLRINHPFYEKVSDALNKLGLINKYNPETKEGDVVGGYTQPTSDGGFSVGSFIFSKDGSVSFIKDGARVEFDKNGNVISENTKEVAQEKNKIEIEGTKGSITNLEKTRDSEAFKYKEATETDVLGNRKKVKRLKTAQELKESTDKINAAIDKAKSRLTELEKNQPQEVSPVEDVVKPSVDEAETKTVNGKELTFYKLDGYDSNSGFAVEKNKNGYIIHSALLPFSKQKQGIGTDFYVRMNNESIEKTGIPLKSSENLSNSGGKPFWEKLVDKGLAEKTEDGFKFKEQTKVANETAPSQDSTIDGNIRPRISNVAESGITKQQSPAKENLPSTVDGGEVKGDVEVDLNLDDVSNFLNEQFGAKKLVEVKETPKPKKEVTPKQDKVEQAKGFISIALDKLTTSLKDFQGRGVEYSKQTYDRIVNEAKEGILNISAIPPVQIWKDPKTGEFVILAGHSRTKAFSDLANGEIQYDSKYKKSDFTNINAQIVEAETLQEAQKIARESNQGAAQTVVDNAKYVRENLLSTFNNFNQAKTKLKSLYGSAWARIYAYANLNPRGKAMQMLKQFQDANESDSNDKSKKIAEWTGKARQEFSNLTDAHENEIFDYLSKNDKIKTYAELSELLNRRVNGLEEFNVNEPLNFEQKVGRGSNEVEIVKQIQELKNRDAEIKKKIRELQSFGKNINDTQRKQIKDLTAESIKINTVDIPNAQVKQKQARVADAEQFDIFSQINEQIENGNITPEQVDEFINDDRKAEEIEPIIEAIEVKAKSENKVELEEVVNNVENQIEREPADRGNDGRVQKYSGKDLAQQENKRPDIVVQAESKMPPSKNFVSKNYEIDEVQKQGVNSALSLFENGGKSFLLADGTGVGKTRQILVIAKEYLNKFGGKVLIISENTTILTKNFANDAKALGIDMNEFEFGTYNDLRTGKKGKDNYGLVIYDEAHNLKNQESGKAIAAGNIKSKNNMYVTATPMDTIGSAVYFISEVSGVTEEQAYNMLGLNVKKQKDTITGQEVKIVTLQEGVSPADIKRNIVKIREEIISKGAMLRREYPFYGEFVEDKISLTEEQSNEQDEIESNWDDRIEYESMTDDGRVNFRKKMNLSGQKSGELSRWSESTKIKYTFKEVVKAIKDRKKVVVIAEGVNETTITAIDKVVPGFLSELSKMLKAEGYKVAEIFGKSDKGEANDKFQANEVDVVLGTAKSASTGIDLDDQNGDSPRVLFMVTPNYSGNVFQQILGRVSRRNTKSPAQIRLLFNESNIDARRKQIVNGKLQTLKAIQEGIIDDEIEIDIQETPTPSVDVVIDLEGITLENISEKAFVVKGDTRPIKDNIKAIGGKYNPKYGWMFPISRKAEVQEMLNKISNKKPVISESQQLKDKLNAEVDTDLVSKEYYEKFQKDFPNTLLAIEEKNGLITIFENGETREVEDYEFVKELKNALAKGYKGIGKVTRKVVDTETKKLRAKAEVDKIADKIKDILPGIDDPDLNKQGISQDDLIDLVASAVKTLVSKGIDINDAIRQVIASIKERFNVDVDENLVKEKLGVEKPQDFESKASKKSVLNRMASGNSSVIKKAISKYSLDYEIENQKEAKLKAEMFVDEVGVDNALIAVRKGLIDGAQGAFIYARAIEILEQEINSLKGDDKLDAIADYQELLGQISDELDNRSRSNGRFIAALAEIYNSSNGRYNLKKMVNDYKAQNNGTISKEVLEKLKNVEEKLKVAEAKLAELEAKKRIEEENEAFNNILEAVARKKRINTNAKISDKQKAKAFADKLRSFKISNKANLSAATPFSIAYDLAIETAAKALEVTGFISDAIKAGVNSIRNAKLSKDEQEQALSDLFDLFDDSDVNTGQKGMMSIDLDGKLRIPHSLIREKVENGIDNIDDLVFELMTDAQELFPDLDFTERQIRDIVTGYGKVSNPTTDEIETQISIMKSLGKIASGLEDAYKGQRPLRSGQQRREPTVKERTEMKKLKALLRDLPLADADIKKAYKTALEAIKKRLSNEIEELDEQIANGEKRKGQKSVIEYDQEAKDLKAERDAKKALLDEMVGKPELTEQQKIDRAEKTLQKRLDDLQQKIDNSEIDYAKKAESVTSAKLEEMRKLKKELESQIQKMRQDSGLAEERLIEIAKRNATKRLATLKERIANKDFEPRKRKPTPTDVELNKIKSEIAEQKEIFDKEVYKLELKNRRIEQKALDVLKDILSIPKILSFTADLSFVGIQNVTQIYKMGANSLINLAKTGKLKGTFRDAMAKTFKAMASPDFEQKFMQAVKANPNYQLWKDSKLGIVESHYKESAKAEVFQHNALSTLFDILGNYVASKGYEKAGDIIKNYVNIISIFERGQTVFENQMRINRFQEGVDLLKAQGLNPIDDIQEYRKVAAAVNTLTGRANTGSKVASALREANGTLFSSFSNWAAGVNQLNPYWYYTLTPTARKMALTDVAHHIIGAGSLISLAALYALGQDDDDEDKVTIETDPTSSDFAVIRSGNLRIDPWAGKKTTVVAFSRLINGGKTDKYGNFKKYGIEYEDEDWIDLPLEYAGNKIAPGPRFALDRFFKTKEVEYKGRTFREDKYGVDFKESKYLIPLIFENFREVNEEQPNLFGKATMALSWTGLINTNVYGGMKEGFKDMPDDLIEKEYKVKIQKIKDNEKILDSAIEKMTKDYVEKKISKNEIMRKVDSLVNGDAELFSKKIESIVSKINKEELKTLVNDPFYLGLKKEENPKIQAILYYSKFKDDSGMSYKEKKERDKNLRYIGFDVENQKFKDALQELKDSKKKPIN